MAKPNTNLSKESVNEAANDLMTTGKTSTGISWDAAFDFAEKQDVEVMKALSGGEWLKMEKFGTFTFAFMGLDTARTDEGEVEVVKLTDREGKEYISSLAVLLSVCKGLKQIPTFIKIVYEADKKGTNGKYKDLKIYSL